jgi:hypothetical protein
MIGCPGALDSNEGWHWVASCPSLELIEGSANKESDAEDEFHQAVQLNIFAIVLCGIGNITERT